MKPTEAMVHIVGLKFCGCDGERPCEVHLDMANMALTAALADVPDYTKLALESIALAAKLEFAQQRVRELDKARRESGVERCSDCGAVAPFRCTDITCFRYGAGRA
jgi:hypothetical protein